VQQARLDVELVKDLDKVIVRDFFLGFLQRSQDHRFNGVDAHDLVKQLGRHVDHQIDLAALVKKAIRSSSTAEVIRVLPSRFFDVADGLELGKGADDDMGLGHHAGDAAALESGQGRLQHFAGLAREHPFAALGIELELLQRGQHGRRAGLEQRVGEAQVLGVVRQGHGHVVVAHARQEQHQVVVEVVAQLLLHVAHGAHLQQAAQPAPVVTGTRVTTCSRRWVSLFTTVRRPTW
jgi:hypothetical protein